MAEHSDGTTISKATCIRLGSFLCCFFVLFTVYVTQKYPMFYATTHDTPETPTVQLTSQKCDDVTNLCDAIVKGDNEKMVALRKNMNFPWRDYTTDVQVLKIAKNCTELRMRYRFPPFFHPNITKDELDFPIAYTMLAHKRVNQILILLSAIYREHNIHCIHLDQKSKPVIFEALQRAVRCFPNVVLASERKKVYYAHVSRLEADIVCMKDMLRIKSPVVSWKYLINLCSQDFPMRTNLEIVKQLKELCGRNSIAGRVDIDGKTKERTRFVYRLIHSGKQKQGRLVIRRTTVKHSAPPYNLTVVKNLAYNIYTREFLKWALLEGPVGPALLEWSQDTYSPDEHYWLMLNRHPNAPGGSITPSRSLARTVKWMVKGRSDECHGRIVHNICVFGAEDIHQLMRRNMLFVNKFDVTVDSSGPTCIRRLLDERALLPNNIRNETNPDKAPVKIKLT